jgi:hypothetical protein
MAGSAHANVRGTAVKFYQWLDEQKRGSLPEGPACGFAATATSVSSGLSLRRTVAWRYKYGIRSNRYRRHRQARSLVGDGFARIRSSRRGDGPYPRAGHQGISKRVAKKRRFLARCPKAVRLALRKSIVEASCPGAARRPEEDHSTRFEVLGACRNPSAMPSLRCFVRPNFLRWPTRCVARRRCGRRPDRRRVLDEGLQFARSPSICHPIGHRQ